MGRISDSCTGWLTSFGAVLTAGHCYEAGPLNIQFNVPMSRADGTVAPPPFVGDTYPMVFFAYRNDGTGDWAVASPGVALGEAPAVRQKAFVRLSALAITPNQINVRVTGFGVDGPAPNYGQPPPRNSYSQTNQTAMGPYIGPAAQANRICYTADTMPGDSGAPVMINGSEIAIAIHVAGTSDVATCGQAANIGTLLTHPDLVAAMQRFPGGAYNIPGDRTVFVDQDSTSTVGDGTVLSPIPHISAGLSKAVSASADALVTIAPGDYVDANITVPVAHNIVVTLPAGDVRLWLLTN